MHNKITTEMSICQAENGFSLDELVKKVADAYEKKAFAEILKMNLLLTQEVLLSMPIKKYPLIGIVTTYYDLTDAKSKEKLRKLLDAHRKSDK